MNEVTTGKLHTRDEGVRGLLFPWASSFLCNGLLQCRASELRRVAELRSPWGYNFPPTSRRTRPSLLPLYHVGKHQLLNSVTTESTLVKKQPAQPLLHHLKGFRWSISSHVTSGKLAQEWAAWSASLGLEDCI